MKRFISHLPPNTTEIRQSYMGATKKPDTTILPKQLEDKAAMVLILDLQKKMLEQMEMMMELIRLQSPVVKYTPPLAPDPKPWYPIGDWIQDINNIGDRIPNNPWPHVTWYVQTTRPTSSPPEITC